MYKLYEKKVDLNFLKRTILFIALFDAAYIKKKKKILSHFIEKFKKYFNLKFLKVII